MQRKPRPDPNEEPAVTFEIEEAARPGRKGGMSTAGASLAAGAGLLSGGATPDVSDSLDVFDQLDDDRDAQADEIPTTSFSDIGAEPEDRAFPPLDFATADEPDETPSGGSDEFHGATGGVGGGFRLDDPAGAAALGAPEPGIEPVDDSLAPADPGDNDLAFDEDDPSDID